MSDPTAEKPSPSAREFLIRRKPFSTSYTIWQETGTSYGYPVPVHWVKIGTRLGKEPELALLDAPHPEAPTIAVCHMPAFSLDFKLGFGNPKRPHLMIWEDLKAKSGSVNAEYRMQLNTFRKPIPPTEGLPQVPQETLSNHGPQRRREFLWRRIKRDGGSEESQGNADMDANTDANANDDGGGTTKSAGKGLRALVARNWKMEDGDGLLVATFHESSAKGICGSLMIKDETPSDLDTVAMITMLALYERRRRS